MAPIPLRQNDEDLQKLMRARQQVYSEATRIQSAQLLATVAVPLIAAIAGLALPAARPLVAVVAFFAVVIDILVLDRWQRKKLKLAAKISEQFDCDLFELEWNAFVADKRASPEDIDSAARAWRGDESLIRDWYPNEAAAAPPYMARIICQRANLQYDSRLREQLGDWLLWAVIGVGAGLAIVSLVASLDASSIATTLLAPATPFLVWALRERYRQQDASAAIIAVRDEADKVWQQVLASACGEDQCKARSREFQDAIYARRVANPLVLPLVYDCMRGDNEARMRAGAADHLRQVGISA